MKRFFAAATLLLTAAALSAGTFGIENFERDGRPVLVPEVRKYEAGQGVFKLPSEVSVLVPAGEELITEQLASDPLCLPSSLCCPPLRALKYP